MLLGEAVGKQNKIVICTARIKTVTKETSERISKPRWWRLNDNEHGGEFEVEVVFEVCVYNAD